MFAESIELKDRLVLHKPKLYTFEREKFYFFVDSEAPNWTALDANAARILNFIDGERCFGDIVRAYAQATGFDGARAWRDAHDVAWQMLDLGIAAPEALRRPAYPGRAHYLKPQALTDFWVHLLQTCNLSCTHCLVSSSPQGEKGLDTAFYLSVISQAYDSGARRFYFTGGEPFAREDIFDLAAYITKEKDCDLIVLTNATLFTGERLKKLKDLSRERVKFQVSLDGATPAINDAIRGPGVFARAAEGLKALGQLGFSTTLTAVATNANIRDLEHLPPLAKELGSQAIHLMWLHKRGRILGGDGEPSFPGNVALFNLALKAKDSAERLGLAFDNLDSLRSRINGRPGIKYDLGRQCWESLCLYMDGGVYPSAALAGHVPLRLGDARSETLRSLWLDSPVAQAFRAASLRDKPESRHPFRFFTGGGDIEHGYFFSANGKTGSLLGEDPYHELYVLLMKELMLDLAKKGESRVNPKTGFQSPQIYHAMGRGAVACSEDAGLWLSEGRLPEVKLTHSNCVLSFDVEKPYKIVRQFYGQAAIEPQKELCCPIKYDNEEISHIPQAVIDRFYGCGSPVILAGLKSGETMLDLGSGAGIDCFIAAKKAGAQGKVIGVDMTEQMLTVARESQKIVAQNLGFDVVEFRKGYLERIPAPDKSVDLVTSNCVINLSPNKQQVFDEIWRILKDHGRLVVADIVCERPVPLNLQAHRGLWGECISGSLSEREFLTTLEAAGFYGLAVLKKTFWKEVEGYKFYSLTVRGYKFEKRSGCSFVGQKAIYLGPFKAAMDDEGHLFPRAEAIEVCTDTAAKLKQAPYAGQFAILEPSREPLPLITIAAEPVLAGESSGCCAPGSGSECC